MADRRATDLERIAIGDIRVGVLDIEASDLETDREDHGYMFCACIKEVRPDSLDGPIHTVRIDDKRNPHGLLSDRWVVKETIKLMNSFDVIVTWYGSVYDIPFVNTRAWRWGMRVPKKKYRRDLYFALRGALKTPNKRLVTVDTLAHGTPMKTRLKRRIWDAAFRGDKEAIQYIVTHCERDVIPTEKLYKKALRDGLLGPLRRR